MEHSRIAEVATHFDLGGDLLEITPIVQGHINATYRIATSGGSYVLQRINTTVFKDPEALMRNIAAVTSYLRERGEETLEIVPTADGRLAYSAEDGVYRVYVEIQDVISYNLVTDPEIVRKAGAAFGRFQNELADFDASQLVDTIPNFHNTPSRYEAFEAAVAEDVVGRAESVAEEIQFLRERKADYSVVVDAIADGSVPLRVTHNDTKINNILMDAETGNARAIIDLDTVMSGSLLYDFGDALRTGGATAEEDEKDLSKMHFDASLFEAYARGFVGELGDTMTDRERELLPFSVKLLTEESALRFLTDYLQGDVYFGIHRPEHNLDRTRTQIALVKDIERQEDELAAIIARS